MLHRLFCTDTNTGVLSDSGLPFGMAWSKVKSLLTTGLDLLTFGDDLVQGAICKIETQQCAIKQIRLLKRDRSKSFLNIAR